MRKAQMVGFMRRISNVVVFSLAFVLFGCSNQTQKDIKDLSDILPESERNYDQNDSLEVQNGDTLGFYQQVFSSLGKLDSILPYEEDLFPDRVGPETVEKFRLNIDGEETIFVKWRFSDSLRVTNALFNWLDCFGPKCHSIRVAEERKLQRNAFQVLANDTVLIYIESNGKLNADTWDKHFEKQEYKLDWNYRMEQAPNGKVRWFEYIDEEKTPLKNEQL